MKPEIHARSSAKKYGGDYTEYLEIHQLMDSSKSAHGDNRHRCVTHNAWFIGAGGPLERIFGVSFTNSIGRVVQVRDIGEQHILEDFGNKYIPTLSDYLEEMEYKPWMGNEDGAEPPSSAKKLHKDAKTKKVSWNNFTKYGYSETDNNAVIDGVKDMRTRD